MPTREEMAERLDDGLIRATAMVLETTHRSITPEFRNDAAAVIRSLQHALTCAQASAASARDAGDEATRHNTELLAEVGRLREVLEAAEPMAFAWAHNYAHQGGSTELHPTHQRLLNDISAALHGEDKTDG